jgi:gas vesicle protein GvpO
MTEHRSSNGGNRARRPTRTAVPSPAQLTRRACAELGELLGREPEGVVSLERTDDGWRLGVEVVETRRIPDTADVLAEYEVDVNSRGRLMGYRRARRYARGQVRDDS